MSKGLQKNIKIGEVHDRVCFDEFKFKKAGWVAR